MGLFGGGKDDEPSETEQLLNQQIMENRAELERKKQDLYKTRLDIIKAQGGQQWTPEAPKAANGGRGFGGLSQVFSSRGRVNVTTR